MFERFKLDKRLTDMEETMRKLVRIVESHDLDMADMRARCKRLLDRTEKAAKRVVESEEVQQPEGAVVGAESNNGGLLTPRQRTIQQQILKRRAGVQ